MKVTEIEVHQIMLEYQDFLAYQLNHYYGPTKRTIYIAHTDSGLEGLGESGITKPPDVIQQYIGTNPFDWISDETSLGLGTAMYDLMGQAVGVPVYKLFGQRYRAWVSVGSWTVSTNPDRMAETGEHYACQGYTWMKYHLSPFKNAIEQAEAMEAGPMMFNLAQSFVGFEAAVALNDFAKNYERVVTVEQLLNGDRVEALAAFSLNEHCAMIEKIESEEICQAEFSDDHVENLAKYFVSLPSEAAMKLWNVISQGGVQENVVKFHRANNGSVGSHLSQILGA